MARSPDDPLDRIACPGCGSRIAPKVRHAGKRVRCRQCKAVVVVPEAPGEEWDAFEIEAPPAPSAPAQPRLPDAYQRAKEDLEARLAAAPKPPRWMFVEGVFTFPFRPEVALRWLTLTGGLVGCGLLAWPALIFGLIAMVLFGMSVLVALVWLVTYAASMSLTIVEQTSDGNDEMQWPDLGLGDRLLPAATVVFLAGLAVGLGWLAGWPLERVAGQVGHWSVAILVSWIVFPILLLSAMDRGNPLLPWSPDVLRSLWSELGSWAAFYLLGGLTLLVAWGAPAVLVILVPIVGIFLVPPFVAASLLIYARLLGRLAWRINLKR